MWARNIPSICDNPVGESFIPSLAVPFLLVSPFFADLIAPAAQQQYKSFLLEIRWLSPPLASLPGRYCACFGICRTSLSYIGDCLPIDGSLCGLRRFWLLRSYTSWIHSTSSQNSSSPFSVCWMIWQYSSLPLVGSFPFAHLTWYRSR